MSPFVTKLAAAISDQPTETLEQWLQQYVERDDRDYVEAIALALSNRR